MEINLSDMLFAALNFLIMVGILSALLYKPLQKVLNARQTMIYGLKARTESNAAQTENLLKSAEEKRAAAALEAKRIVGEARLRGEDGYQKILASAEDEKRDLLKKAGSEADSLKKQAEKDISREVVLLSEEMMKYIAGRVLSKEDHTAIIDRAIEHLDQAEAAVPAGADGKTAAGRQTPHGFGAGPAQGRYRESPSGSVPEAVVTTIQPLSPAQKERIAAQIRRWTGASAEIAERIDPSLLGGLRLQIGDYLLDGSVSKQISDMKKGLLAEPETGGERIAESGREDRPLLEKQG